MNQLLKSKFSGTCGALTFLLAAICLFGWYSNNLAIAAFNTRFIMMAPSTGICFCLLSTGLLLLSWRNNTSRNGTLFNLLILLSLGLSTFAIISFIFGFDSIVDRLLTGTVDKLGSIPIGRMSPITAVLFLFSCFSLFLALERPGSRGAFYRNSSSMLSLLVLLTGFVIIVGYWYNVPFFYNGSFVPPALPTAICFFVLSVGISSHVARKSSLFGVFFGDSVFARLVRNMVPMIVVLILVEGWTDVLDIHLFANQAINHLLNTMIVVVLIIAVIATISRRTSLQLAVAEETLKKSQTLLHDMSEIAKIGGWEFFTDTLTQVWTEETFHILEVKFDKGAPNVPQGVSFIAPEYRPMADKAVQRAMEFGEPYDQEWEVVTAKGNRKWVRAKAKASLTNGKITSVSGSFQDITERKQADEAVWKASKNWQASFDAIEDYMLLLKPDHSILEINRTALKSMGKKRDEVIGRRCFELIHNTLVPIPACPCDKAVLSKVPEVVEYSENGRICELVAWPVLDDKDQVTAIVHIVRDITDRKRMEEELRKSQKLESLGVLAGGIAHDFNNLMGGIFGYIDMASEASTENKVTSYLSKAMNTIDRARALTLQLLTFAKGGAPVQKIDNLFPFVEETAKFALSGANVSCQFDVQDDLWACNFDKNQIGQVIDNLIINSQQAMPVGGTMELTARNISLSEKEHPLLENGDYVKISVKDSGIGIPRELIAKIFDPFFTTKPKGHGLGLATCYSIINRHGGCIDVESEQGKGSTFKVYLPASTEAASSVAVNTNKTHKGSGIFLIMDDEEVMRDTIGDMLETLGYTVVSKENGKDAIDFFASETKANREITGMIFDLTVPGGMGGKAAIDEIRKTNKEIPAFVASGYADDPVMKKPAEHGFTASICKPFRKSELSDMLNKYMKPK